MKAETALVAFLEKWKECPGKELVGSLSPSVSFFTF